MSYEGHRARTAHLLSTTPVEEQKPRRENINVKLAELYRESQAAKLLNLSVKTLQRWRWEGHGPQYRKLNGRAVRYTKDDLLRFIEDSARASTSAAAK